MLNYTKKDNKDIVSVESLRMDLEVWETETNKNKTSSSFGPLNWSTDKFLKSLKMRDNDGHTIFQLSIKELKINRVDVLWELRRMKKFLLNHPVHDKSKGQLEFMKNLLEDIKQSQMVYEKNTSNDGEECTFKDVLSVFHSMIELPMKAKAICQEKPFIFMIESLEEILITLEYDFHHYTADEEEIQLMLDNAPFLYVKMFVKNKTLLMTLIRYCHEALSFAQKYINQYFYTLDQMKSEGEVLELSEFEEENDLYESLDMYTVEKFMIDLSVWKNNKENDNDRLYWSDEMLQRSLIIIDENKDTILQACIMQEKEEIINIIWQLRREKKIRVFEFDCSIPENILKMESYEKLLDDIVKNQEELLKISRGIDYTDEIVIDMMMAMAKFVLKWRKIWKDETLYFLFRGFDEIVERLTHNRNLDARKPGQTTFEHGLFCCDLIVKNKSLLVKLLLYSKESLDRMKSYLKAVFFFNQVGFANNVLIASKLWEPNFKEILTIENLSILEVAARGGNPRMLAWLMEACDLKIGDSKDVTSISAAKILYQAVAAKVNSDRIIDRLFKTVSSSSWEDLLLQKLDDDSNTAIHCAVKNKNLPAVLKLCEYGVLLDVLNKKQQAPKAVIEPESENILKFFNEMEMLFEAASNGKFDVVQALLNSPIEQEDAKLNAKISGGLTVNKLLQRHLGKVA